MLGATEAQARVTGADYAASGDAVRSVYTPESMGEKKKWLEGFTLHENFRRNS